MNKYELPAAYDKQKYLDSFRMRGKSLPRLSELHGVNEADLEQKEAIIPSDIIKRFHPETNFEDRAEIQRMIWILEATGKERFLEKINRDYELRIRELWELYYRDTDWEVFRNDRMANYRGAWIYDRIDNKLRRTLTEEDFYLVAFSRTFPLIGMTERQRIRESSLFASGLSTGAPVLEALIRIAVSKVIASDGDRINLSNLRMGSSDADVGRMKAIWMAHEMSKVNPYIAFVVFAHKLDPEDRRAAIESTNLTIEMTDDFVNKWGIREEAHEANSWVFMGTGIGWQPLISSESPTDPLFLRPDLDDTELEMMQDPTTDPVTRTVNALRIIGLENIPPRQMLAFLFAKELGYWSQLPTTAQGAAFGLSYMIYAHLNEVVPAPEIQLDLPHMILTSETREELDQELFGELLEDPRFQDEMQEYSSLLEAVRGIALQRLGIHYNWEY